jgi:hypothetical protein
MKRPGTIIVVFTAGFCALALPSCQQSRPAVRNDAQQNQVAFANTRTPESSAATLSQSSQLHGQIIHARSFEQLKAALMETYPAIQDVKWFPPTKDDPEPELQLIFEKSGVSDASRGQLRDYYRQIVPVLIQADSPWQVLNFDNGNIILLVRRLSAGYDLSHPTDETIEQLHQASMHD